MAMRSYDTFITKCQQSNIRNLGHKPFPMYSIYRQLVREREMEDIKTELQIDIQTE